MQRPKKNKHYKSATPAWIKGYYKNQESNKRPFKIPFKKKNIDVCSDF
jgi:hypothetical protein